MAYFTSLAGRAVVSSAKTLTIGSVITGPTRTQATLASNIPKDAKSWSEIPRTKTTLGLNIKLMKDMTKFHDYLLEQTNILGHVFRLTGLPGLPKSLVCAVNPEDLESIYRAGDTSYPMRFPFDMWKDARRELNKPFGVFFL